MQTAYDIVGEYNQDRINGFDEKFLTSFVELIELENANNILDAMGGNGNLIRRTIDYCLDRNIVVPAITLLDCSSVQIDFAQAAIKSDGVRFIHGDILSMTDLRSGKKLPLNSFDRIVIKSGNHEIPLNKQEQLYQSIFQLLTPNGLFINLGFVFDEIQERDEFAEITRVKDNLVGAKDSVTNRYFLMRQELYRFLNLAGFELAQEHVSFEYVIRSEIVEKEYFSNSKLNNGMVKLRAAQEQATMLIKQGRILLEANRSTMRIPGEITVAIKPQ